MADYYTNYVQLNTSGSQEVLKRQLLYVKQLEQLHQ